ncbi:hypothetical protein ABZ016_13015 [Streptomyces sp. NPDC006372]
MEPRKPNRRLRTLTRTVGYALLRGAVTALGTLAVQHAWQWLTT